MRCVHQKNFDLIGLNSAFDDDSGSLLANGTESDVEDLRLRLAVAAPDRAAVESALQEVLAPYCCWPAGDGQRSRVTQRIETRSYLVSRKSVEATHSLH